ncbi:hypothetical protein CCHL11_03694 [Colletotrichum chlorophyti]|uniref:Uncharacterized protein n=1 Tax=Colletotrichum chlorophyti TaxID=708187 RepID=A0A1Q8RSA4_9PEZI|nr:hypothetical protein CCHL11_03694 [Colletotrichum chlorophyti]
MVVDFLQSLMCLCTDHSEVDIHVIVSDSGEVSVMQDALSGLQTCGQTFGIFPVPPQNRDGPKPNVNIVNFFDIIPPVFHSMTRGNITRDDTSALLKERGKLIYQALKKLAAAVKFDYDYALWLDSEAIVVQPFSIRKTFDEYVKKPTIWRSRMSNTDFMHALMGNTADVLGRSIESFGQAFWNLESMEWIIEKAVIEDLIHSVEKAHNQDFWTIWTAKGGPFEVCLYNMHVQARKLESTNSIFSKYLILETEREMEKFGLTPAKPIMDTMSATGLLERGFFLLRVPEIAPNFSSMLREYNQRLFRFDFLDIAPPEVVDRFLLDTPVDILCSGAPQLHSWWTQRKDEVVLNKSLS